MAEAALTPDIALQYLGELSTDIRTSVLLGADGEIAAAAPAAADAASLRRLTLRFFEQADDADDQEVAQIEVSTGDAAVYATRERNWTVAVVTGRFSLPSLMFYDLRTVLAALEETPG